MRNSITSRALLAIILSLCVISSYAKLPSTQPIQWRAWSPEVFKIAKKEHKLVLVYGHVTWCHWCQLMNESTFPDPLVEQIVNAYYVPVQFDVEGDARLTSHYQVSDLPTILIVDDHDKVIKKFTGYYSSRRLAGSLQALANEQALT